MPARGKGVGRRKAQSDRLTNRKSTKDAVELSITTAAPDKSSLHAEVKHMRRNRSSRGVKPDPEAGKPTDRKSLVSGRLMDIGKGCSILGASEAGQFRGTVHFVTSLTQDAAFTLKGTIVFDQVDENIGGAYNPDTGEFTAPVSGFYLFTVQVMVTGGPGQEYELKCEDSAYSTRVRVESAWSTGSGTAVCHVREGHKVKVIKYYGPAGSLRQSPWTRFSGFLLRES